jgi:predicted MFS family arabinose efflux permease
MEVASNRWRTGKAILGLGTTQVIGWGATFNSLSLLALPISSDLGISRPMVFVGVTVMLLVSALLAPRFGRLVDRFGARPLMAIGSVIMAVGLLALAAAHGIVTYLIAWAILGVATPLALTQSAMPGLVQVVGPSARRAITGLTLSNGLSSTIMLPLMEAMLATWGWRATFVGLAALNLIVCLPMHLEVLDRGPPTRPGGSGGSGKSWDGLLPEGLRARALVLIAIWSCMEGLITWGLYMQAIDLFSEQGIPRSTAIVIWMLVGPMQALARFVDLMLGNRSSINGVALISAILVMVSFAVLLPFGISTASATGFAFVMGLGHGLFAIARNMLPLTLFGQREYGAYMGRLMLPQNIFNAGAPVAFAAIITNFGPTSALWLTWCSSTIALVSVILLVRYCHAATTGKVVSQAT